MPEPASWFLILYIGWGSVFPVQTAVEYPSEKSCMTHLQAMREDIGLGSDGEWVVVSYCQPGNVAPKTLRRAE